MTVQELVVLVVGLVAGLVGFIKGVEYLIGKFKETINRLLTPVTNELQILQKSVCTNYLVRFLADVERGEALDNVERQRFWETYENYIRLGGNSYIKEKVNSLKSQNKL